MKYCRTKWTHQSHSHKALHSNPARNPLGPAARHSKTARPHNPERHYPSLRKQLLHAFWCDTSALCSYLDLSEAFLCRSEQKYQEECSEGEFSSAPAAIFFVSFLVFGVGTSVYHTLGISYLDDNAKKNKTPFLLGNRPCIKIPCRNVKDLPPQNLTSPRVLA